MKTLFVGLDIDSTVISHCYPHMNGRDLGAVPWLLKLQAEYPVVFLTNTMRSGASLELAVKWLTERGIEVGGLNAHPTQHEWTASPKVHCHIYIEDRAAGTPVDDNMNIDWDRYGPMVVEAVDRWHHFYEQNGASATGPVGGSGGVSE